MAIVQNEPEDDDRGAGTGSGSGNGGNEGELPALKKFESFAKLQESDEVKHRCVSETPGVELLKTASGQVYIMASEKRRILPKFTLLAGFGTGKPHG